MKVTNIVIKQGEKILGTVAEGEFDHRKVIRFSSLEIDSRFEDLAGNKWIKLDEVQAAAPLLPSLTKENFPAEQLVYIYQ